ncbi:tetratricopeptide (TPR) repeat protein [Rhizobium soli]|uniref:Tetratricopeptide (TPR) repeat protein n=1 Tax=Rhizobium soli TaxID=424798 RepID=A0A7X0MW93_9HYPH|nr:tetratricopeptide repeat protein [Rhizobium soli]MBB6511128.1 tetratricopeptide (TPR) repeat protein [Rhizobium soli]
MPIRKTLVKLGLLSKGKSEATRLVEKADDANRSRNWAVAESYYAEALKLLPKHAELWVQYGHALKEQGKYDGAEAAYRAGLSFDTASADIYLQLGHVLKLQNRLPDAVNAYQQSLRADPAFSFAKEELDKPEVHILLTQQNSFDDVTEAVASYFDADYYKQRYPDVGRAGVDPLHHYCSAGWREHRNPSDWFDTAYYLQAFSDVRNAGINPFFHYIIFGKEEGRLPKQQVDDRLSLLASLRDDVRPTAPDPVALTAEQRFPQDTVRLARERGKKGVVLSLSHTCYTEIVAGTELVVGKEQLLFNSQGYSYIHLSPANTSEYIYETELCETNYKVVVDGEYIGVHRGHRILDAINASGEPDEKRLFVIHSPLGHSLHALIALGSRFSASMNYYWLHDYSSLCQGYNLLRNHIEFCGAPPLNSVACAVCIFGSERLRRVEQIKILFESIPFVVVSPSEVALKIWRESFTGNRCGEEVVPHGKLVATGSIDREKSASEPITVAFVGYPVEHKGWRVFQAIVAAHRFRADYRFVHFVSDSFEYSVDKKIDRIHAEVRAGSTGTVVELIRANKVDVVVMPSGWPETFSFVTYEAIAAGCKILTLEDSGNVAALVKDMNAGLVFHRPTDLVDAFSDGKVNGLITPEKKIYDFVFTGTTASSNLSKELIDG